MDLCIVRHGIAFDRDDHRWPDDADRPLTEEGEAKFRRAARGIARAANSVDVVLASPFVRAWRTAEILEDEAGWPEPIRCDALEPERGPDEVVGALEPYRAAAVVAIVGHEPLLGEVIAHLIWGPGSEAIPLKKGGAAMVEIDGDLAELRWLLSPKLERALGK